jgi:acylphosphatase
MEENKYRAQITAEGLVQGVGFRYFVIRHAQRLGLSGYTKNLYSGEVLTMVEGSKPAIVELYSLIKTGPSHAHVRKCTISWEEYAGEFSGFSIRH